MNKQLLAFGTILGCCALTRLVAGVEVIAWGINQEGDAVFSTYALKNEKNTPALGSIKVCPVWGFNRGMGGLVLSPDGTVFPAGDVPDHLRPPEGLEKVADIAVGRNCVVALLQDRTVRFWGDSHSNRSADAETVRNVEAVVASTTCYLVVRTNNSTEIVELNGFGQTISMDVADMADVSASKGPFGSRLVVVKQDGTVVERKTSSTKIVPITGISNVVAVAASPVHTVALKNDGAVAAWGSNAYGETSVPDGLDNVAAIAAGGSYPGVGTGIGFSLALKRDGTVVGWGRLPGHQNVVPSGLSNVVAIAAGDNFCLAITTNAAVAARFTPSASTENNE